MPQLKNTMEIFRLLRKTNCRECNEKTCLAFAGAVFLGRRQLDECPHIDKVIVKQYVSPVPIKGAIEEDMEKVFAVLKHKIISMNLKDRAEAVSGKYQDGKLTLKIFGKDFHIFPDGALSSDVHINPWLTIPLLGYLLNCKGLPVSGKWIPFRELKGGRDWAGLFGQRCEKPLKAVADKYTDLFEDMIHIFNGRQVKNHYDSDIALVLHPLPRVPILICYWKLEDELESNLNIFFDATADENLGIEGIYGLGAGIVRMFEKIALRHGLVTL